VAPDEFTLAEAQAKCGQIVRSRPSLPWPDGVIGEIVDVSFAPSADGHPADRVVFTVAWQLFPQDGAVPCTAIPLSKSQYQDQFQEIWLADADQYNHLFGKPRTGRPRRSAHVLSYWSAVDGIVAHCWRSLRRAAKAWFSRPFEEDLG
jgi:hypothetical protein